MALRHLRYGIDEFSWRLAPKQGSDEGYELPLTAWSPSVGVSSLIEVRGDRFPIWAGDLLVGSLRAGSLFRLRLRDERVVSIEEIHLGRRVRDLVELDSGPFMLLTDSRSEDDQGMLMILDRASVSSEKAFVDLNPALESCVTCHTFGEGMGEGMGPNLWGVLGSPVASHPRFAHSQALLQVGGRWTESRLRALLSDPSGFAPGTTMPAQPDLTNEQVEQIISALRALQ